MSGRGPNRRALLRGGCGAAIALPLLTSLGWRRGTAQAAPAAVKRFLAYVQPLGTFPELFWPLTPGSKRYTFPSAPANVFRTGSTAVATSDFELGPSLEALAAHKRELLVIEGVDNADGNHPAFASVLTGRKTGKAIGGSSPPSHGIGPSIDQVLAGTIGKETRFGVLNFAGNQKNGASEPAFGTNSWYEGANKPALPIADPAVMFDRLFADFVTRPGAPNYLREQRKSILDAALGQAQSVRARLGNDDRLKVDGYLEGLRAVEAKLVKLAPSANACEKPATRPKPAPTSGSGDVLVEIADAQLELLALAFACDLTRVATFQIASEANTLKQPWLGITADWHTLSHTGPADPRDQKAVDSMVRHLNQLAASVNWNLGRLAKTITRLKELGAWEGTVAFYTSGMSNGQVHTSNNIPIVLVGSLGGFLKQQHYVRLAATDKHYVNDVLVTLLRGFGTDVNAFGDADKSKGPLGAVIA